MQTLWTRVAQVRGGCRCPQCLSTANGVSRRATGTATRRAPKYLTTSTLWYSGIFAAAATFDAGVKKHRREQWDRAIADVKQELEQTVKTPNSQRTEMPEAVTADLTNTETQFKPFNPLSDGEDEFRHVDPLRPSPYWPASTGLALRVDHLPPESIYATDFRKRRLDINPLYSKKLVTVEVAVEILLSEILLEMGSRGWGSDAASVVPEQFAKSSLLDVAALTAHLDANIIALSKLKSLKETQWEQNPIVRDSRGLCHFSQDTKNLEQANSSVRGLNSSLLQLFRLHAHGEVDKPSLLAKLTHNISRCSGPPNLRTFNTLMVGFSAMDEPGLVDKVIKSTRAARMRPNEVTLATILRHYTKTDRPDLFVHWVELMRGKHGGLALARGDVEVSKGGQSRLVRKDGNAEKIVQLPYATPYVFGPLVAGVVKFAGFETALSICQNMGMEGWGLCMSGLTPLLDNCAERADWNSGFAVWNQIQALKAISRRKKGNQWLSERVKLDTFAAMLRLCSRCDRREHFDSIWASALRVHEGAMDRLVELVKDGAQPEHPDKVFRTISDETIDQRELVARHTGQTLSQPESAVHPHEDLGGLEQGHLDYRRETQLASVSAETSNSVRDEDPAPGSRFQTLGSGLGHIPKAKSMPPKPRMHNAELLEDQLWGLLPTGADLDSYELLERPMTLQMQHQYQ